MTDKNSILETAFKLFEYISPDSLTDPEKAYKKLIDTMGWILIEQNEQVSVEQLKHLKDINIFEGKNLVQIKKIIEGESSKIGPEPKKMAEKLTLASLEHIGIKAKFVPLTEEEKQKILTENEIH